MQPYENTKALNAVWNKLSVPELLGRLLQDEFDWSLNAATQFTLLMKFAWDPSVCTVPIVNCIMSKVPSSALTIRSGYGSTALHFAANMNNVNMLIGLLATNQSALFLGFRNEPGRTAMEEAAWFGCKDAVQVFLSYGILDSHVVENALHHCNIYNSTRLLRIVVLESPLVVLEDLQRCKDGVMDYFDPKPMYGDTKAYFDEVVLLLEAAMKRQHLYIANVHHELLHHTPLIPDLISLVDHYALRV